MEELKAGALTAARTGRGRDLVFVHSLLPDRHAVDPVMPGLATRFRVTLPNLPGFHGAKPVAALIEAYAEWLRDGFGAFEIGLDAVLLRHGFGGTVALAFAIASPDRIARLVLVD